MLKYQELSKGEKIKLIKEIAGNYDIRANQIGTETSISVSSVTKIFNGEQKNPRDKTLNTILKFLEFKTSNKTSVELTPEMKKLATPQVAEEADNYGLNFKDLKIDDKLNIIYKVTFKLIAKN